MSEEKTVSRPMQLWNSALKAVKGDSTTQLVEQFTSEMTLVAEGLCEDQAKLRQQVEALRREEDRLAQGLRSEIDALETTIRENQRDTDRRLDDMGRRLAAMENRHRNRRGRELTLMQHITLLAAMICGSWIVVTVLQLFQ